MTATMRAAAATVSGRHAAPVARVRTITACRGSSKESKTAVAASVPSVQRPDRRGTCVAHQIRSFSWNSGVARSRCFHNRQLTPNALSTDTSVDRTTPSVSETTPNETGAPLRYEIVKGALVRWSHEKPEGPHPATCVLIHGILGSRRNLLSFAKRLAVKFPSWQFVLVDLRCHGQTASLQVPPPGDNDVTSAARDVLATLNKLKIYPNTLLGHSFGGKVAMSMVHQFGKRLPRPVQVWVLDTVPGDVWATAGDHPRDTINHCVSIEMPVPSRKFLVDSLTGAGFTLEGAQWMTTNLQPVCTKEYPNAKPSSLQWTFHLPGIVEMYKSYELTDLWPMLETQPIGLRVDFVRAERSAFVWDDADISRMQANGARVHFLENSSHWVHIDNPEGLLEILAPSFGVVRDRR